MVRLAIRWIWLGATCAIFASAGCREHEPLPRHNRNLGTEGQYLLPTTSEDVGGELAGNRGVEILDRRDAAAFSRTAEADAADDAPVEGDAAGEGKGVISSFLRRLTGAAGADAPTTEAPATDAGEEPAPEEE